jgi:hypothetical protein
MDFRYLRIDRAPSPPLLKILHNNIIGTPEYGMLYQHINVDEKINKLADPYFVNLVRGGQVAGTCCFCNRITLNNNNPIRSFYARYFSFQEVFRQKSIHEKRHRSGIIRAEVELLLSGRGLNVTPEEKFFFYAYVDPRNKRSALLCDEFGFETIRQYTPVLFGRMNPREQGMLSIAEVLPDEGLMALLKDFYHEYNMLSFENLEGRKYFIVKDETGQPVGGVLVNPDAWKIHSLPGTMGKITLNMFSRLPFLKKLINRNFAFVSFDAVFVKPGFERALEGLLESLLFKFEVNTGIFLVDTNSAIYTTLKSLDLGVAEKLSKKVTGNVICRFANFSKSEKEQFLEKPAYLSAIDAT